MCHLLECRHIQAPQLHADDRTWTPASAAWMEQPCSAFTCSGRTLESSHSAPMVGTRCRKTRIAGVCRPCSDSCAATNGRAQRCVCRSGGQQQVVCHTLG